MINPGRRKSTQSSKSSIKPPSGQGNVDPKQDAQKRILEAARMEFTERGFAGAKMRPIAMRAKVNSALLHYYYRNKESLYQAALLDMVHSVWGNIEANQPMAAAPMDLPELLRGILRRYFDIVLTTPEFPRFMFREMIEGGKHLPMVLETVQSRYGTLVQTVVHLLKKEIEAGHLRPISLPDFLLNLAGMALSSVIFALAAPQLKLIPNAPSFHDPKTREKRIDEIVKTLFDGLRIQK